MGMFIKAAIAGLLGAGAFAAAVQALPASQVPDEFPYIWVQYNNPDHSGGVQKRIARVVLEDGGKCPTISENVSPVPMRERALTPSQDNGEFQVTVCTATLHASSAAYVTITDNSGTTTHTLPVLPDTANTVVVVGDTGCRVSSWGTQDCDDATPTDPRAGWPLEKVADRIVAENPDAIIHMGDYHYREADPCPASDQGTCGDTWTSWKADWFNPARPVLAVVPWVLLRGNHENCARAWLGFKLFFSVEPATGSLGDQPNQSGCSELTPSYAVGLDNEITLAVLDTASQREMLTQSGIDYCPTWVTDLKSLLDDAMANPASHWLTLHHPVYKWTTKYPVTSSAEACPAGVFKGQNFIQGTINDNAEAGKTAPSMIFAGHSHMWQWNRPLDGNLPLQMVVGHGGTLLDQASSYALGGNQYIGNTPSSEVFPNTKAGAAAQAKAGLPAGTTGWTNMDIIFGYQVLKRLSVPGGSPATVWRIDMRDINHTLLRVCTSESDPAAAAVVAKSAGLPAQAQELQDKGCYVVAQGGN